MAVGSETRARDRYPGMLAEFRQAVEAAALMQGLDVTAVVP